MNLHDKFVQELKRQAVKKAYKSALSYILSKAPFLAWGPLGPIFSYFLEKIIWVVVNKTEMATFFKFVDFRVDAQGRDYHDAITRVINAKSPEELEYAQKLADERFDRLVSLRS